MSKGSSVEKKLQKILSTQEYHQLEGYHDPETWSVMSAEERELLGTLFVMQGQVQLKKGDKSALKSFDLAAKVAPGSPKVFFHKGVAYSSQHKNIRCLMSASGAFGKATKLKVDYFEAWSQWGHTLLLLGELKSDYNLLQKGLEKFEKAEKLLEGVDTGEVAKFYWHWGHCWYSLGKLSGEAIDIASALKMYAKANELGIEIAEYWNDYGNALAEQACLVGRDEVFIEVVELYLKAIDLNPEDFEAWLNLACCYSRIFEYECDESFFTKAHEAFENASDLYSKNISLWMCWGQLLLNSGKMTRDMEKLHESVDKFQEAYACEPNHPLVLCRLGEAYMNLGAYDESYELLCKAEEIIVRSLELEADNPETWYFYGRCLTEIGRYFDDVKYYFQAIEKYQYGFSLNKQLKLFHYGMALAFYEISELNDDLSTLKQALKHYSHLGEEEDKTLPTLFWVDWGTALMKYGEATQQKHYLEAALTKYEEAILHLGEEVEKNSLLMECLYRYACTLDTLGDMYDDASFYEKAIELLKHLVNIDPKHINARYSLALALAHLGELVSDVESLKKAGEHFDVLTQSDLEDDTAWNDWGVTLLNLGNLVYDPSRPEEYEQLCALAESKFLQATALGNVQAYYNLAGYHSLVGSIPAAMHFLDKAYQAHTLPHLEDIMHDEWLATLRETEEFRDFMAKLHRDNKAT